MGKKTEEERGNNIPGSEKRTTVFFTFKGAAPYGTNKYSNARANVGFITDEETLLQDQGKKTSLPSC